MADQQQHPAPGTTDPSAPATAGDLVNGELLMSIAALDEPRAKLILEWLAAREEREYQRHSRRARHRLMIALGGLVAVILNFVLACHLIDAHEAALAVTTMSVSAVSLSVIYVLGLRPEPQTLRFSTQQQNQPPAV